MRTFRREANIGLLAFLALAGGSVGSAFAQDLVFEQAVTPDDVGVGPGGLLAIGSSCPFGNSSAEDFMVVQDTSLTRITWEGVYFGAASDFPGVDNNFRVTIYLDDGAGNAGAIVADFPSVAVTKTLNPRPPVFGTNPVYTYDTMLPTEVAILGGQRYWLSVNGDPDGDMGPVWGWMVSNDGNAAAIPGNDQPLQTTSITCATLPATSYTPGGELGDQDADLAFALYGLTATGGGLDLHPRSCPNPLNRRARGKLPAAIAGSEDFDVMQVDFTTITLRRTDGVGGEVYPIMGPPGPGFAFADVTSPFDNMDCECEAGAPDGVLDLLFKLDIQELVVGLELAGAEVGDLVQLEVNGLLLDGSPFAFTDCVRIVGR